MYKTLAIALFFSACRLASTVQHGFATYMDMNAPNPYGKYNQELSLSINKVDVSQIRYFFDNCKYYVLFNKISNNAYESKKCSDPNIPFGYYDNDIIPQKFFLDREVKTDIVKQELWLTVYNGKQMYKITDRCVSFIDVYDTATKLSYNEKLTQDEYLLKLKTTFLKMLSQLQEKQIKIFIPALVLTIEKLDKIKEIAPVIYINRIFAGFGDVAEFAIDFTTLPMPKDLFVIPEKLEKTPCKDTITSKNNTGIYKVNLNKNINNIQLKTIDNQVMSVNENL